MGRSAFVGTRREPDRQKKKDQKQHHRMHDDLITNRTVSLEQVRVRVTREQHELEKQQARNPYRGGAAEERKHHFPNHRLEPKQQECTQEQRRSEEEQDFPKLRDVDGGLEFSNGFHAILRFCQTSNEN